MKTKSALVKLIVFMIVTSILTFGLAATIGSLGFGGKRDYKAVFSDVTGLLPGNDIRVAGVRVGQVGSIKVYKRNLALVGFTLDGNRELAKDTILRMRYRNIVGERYIALTEGSGSSDAMPTGSTVPLAQTRNALDLTVLFNGFRPLFQALDPSTVNDAAFEIVQTLQGEGGTVESLMARTASLTNTLADRDKVIGRVITNMTSVLATVDDRSSELSDLVVSLKRLATGFAQDRTAIGSSLSGIGDLTNATAGLLKDIRPPLKSDIGQLRTLANTLGDNRDLIDGILTRLPGKLDTIIGTATYGSYFNFYLCGFDGKLVVDDGTPNGLNLLANTQFVNNVARCKRDKPVATTTGAGK